MDEEEGIDYRVSSELYEEFDYSSAIPSTLNADNVVSVFKFNIPNKPSLPAETDKDGDLVVCRRNEMCSKYEIKIEHSKRTALSLVGLQIWRGALLLADWLIHNRDMLKTGGVILELGSGVGLTSIVASMFTQVVCTDINIGGLLDLIKHNVDLNDSIVCKPVKVCELDFTKEFSPEINTILPTVDIVIAADVVYDDSLTEALISTLQKIVDTPQRSSTAQRCIYVALEKRYVFTVADCDTCAPCYEYFQDCLHTLKNASVEQLAVDFPQYFEYDRVTELVLWKITSTHCTM